MDNPVQKRNEELISIPILVSNISLPFTEPPEQAVAEARRLLGSPPVAEAGIARRSVDARRRSGLCFVYTVRIALEHSEEESALAERIGSPQIRYQAESDYHPPAMGEDRLEHRPVIAGFGPAGLFAGLLLARGGYRPLILERGGDVDARAAGVERFWQTGLLDPECNVQFGEGGAGTFSDGKLTTRISDPRCRHILRELVRHGAPPEILLEAKPHIGTDRLRGVVRSIREEIGSLGGEVRFHTRLDDVLLREGAVKSVRTNRGELPADALILALGHSARDTLLTLQKRGIPLESKPFSVGVRIEHLQSEIDRALYGTYAGHPLLPAGEYQLSHREGGRAVYTFCMCPGGVVVAAASESGMVVTNGMSEYARSGNNAGAALVVSVDSADFGGGATDGLALQRRLEEAAYRAGGGGYTAPFQTVGSLMGSRSAIGTRVMPSYPLGVKETNLAELFPPHIAEMLQTGIRRFGQKLRGFDSPGAALTGVESRTSSPVRIPRNEAMHCPSAQGLYPCGEGAGYAGGIVSAAVDGLRAAEALMSRYHAREGTPTL